MQLLIKYPTRQRPAKFLSTLWQYLYLAEKPEDLTFIISLDTDDEANNNVILAEIAKYDTPATIKTVIGVSKNKIDAINRDIPKEGWDIIVVASDDMIPVETGWDTTIVRDMEENFADLDGCLWYSDSYVKAICTFPIMGRAYFNRFGSVYNKAYVSLWADNEWTEVAQLLGKLYKSDKHLVRHAHPSNDKSVVADELYKRNEGYFGRDKLTYVTRQLAGFYLGEVKAKQTHYTQNNEHQWIDDYFGKSIGVVAEIGANDGKCLSNSLALIERGWEAILVEPSPRAFARLQELHGKNEKVFLVNKFIGTENKVIDFYENDTHLNKGDVGLLSTADLGELAKWEAAGNKFEKTTVHSVPFNHVFPKGSFGMDLISIDAEGFDYEILTQIDLKKIGCKMLIIEYRNDEARFTEYCAKFGMRLIHKNGINLCYVK